MARLGGVRPRPRERPCRAYPPGLRARAPACKRVSEGARGCRRVVCACPALRAVQEAACARWAGASACRPPASEPSRAPRGAGECEAGRWGGPGGLGEPWLGAGGALGPVPRAPPTLSAVSRGAVRVAARAAALRGSNLRVEPSPGVGTRGSAGPAGPWASLTNTGAPGGPGPRLRGALCRPARPPGTAPSSRRQGPFRRKLRERPGAPWSRRRGRSRVRFFDVGGLAVKPGRTHS